MALVLLSLAKLARKAATGSLKPYEMLRIDAMGNQNHRLDFEDVKIIGGKLIHECGLDGVAERVGDFVSTAVETTGDILSDAGDVITTIGETIIDAL